MELRRAKREDLEQFVENRLEFVTLIRKIEHPDEFCSRTKAYLEEHIDKEDLVIFIAVDQEKIVSSCMTCTFQTAPLPSCPTGKMAELLNVYTRSAYRRKGLAEKLIRMLLAELKENNVEKVILEYTEAGFPLYQKLGFTEVGHQMQMKF